MRGYCSSQAELEHCYGRFDGTAVDIASEIWG